MDTPKSISLQLQSWSPGSRASIIGVFLIAAGVFGMLYLGLPVYFLPLSLAALLLALITIRWPTIGLGFVIAAQYIPLQMAGFSLIPIIGAFVGVFCLIWVAVHKRGVVLPSIVFPMLVMVLLSLYSLTFTMDADLTQRMGQKLVINAVFCLLLVNVVDEYRKLRWPLWVLMLMGVVNSVAGVLQFSTRSDPEFRAAGLIGNQNGLGIVAATACLISFYHFLYEKDRRRRLGYLALCALLAAGIVSSISRGATVAFVVALVYILLREARHRKQVLITVVLILAGLPLVPERFFRRFENIGHDMESSIFFGERREIAGRGYYNKAGINIWKAHPLLGVGLGSYGYYFIQPEFNPGMEASRRLPAHNMYVQALAETGLVGFLVLCWWILQSAYNYWVADRKTEDDSHRLLLGSCEAITLYTLVVYSSSGNLVHTPLAIFLTLSAVCRQCGERAAFDQTPPAGE